MVIKFPEVPDREKLENVLVLPAVNNTEAGWVVFPISLNVFDPVMFKVPAPP